MSVAVERNVGDDLWHGLEADPWLELTIDLGRWVARHGDVAHPWRLEDGAQQQQQLVTGTDAISDALRHEVQIERCEAARSARLPSSGHPATTLPLHN